MVTRIRIEAEGPTIQAVQEDVFATHDAILTALYWPSVVPSSTLTDEVYELADSPAPATMPRWYKGRAVIRFPGGADDPFTIQAEQVRGRTARLQELEDEEAKRLVKDAAATPFTRGERPGAGRG